MSDRYTVRQDRYGDWFVYDSWDRMDFQVRDEQEGYDAIEDDKVESRRWRDKHEVR